MKNIPVFTTQYGVASLILEEIPYKKTAYIKIQASEDLESFVEECVSFCRALGAEFVYATGHGGLIQYPLYTSVWRMRRAAEGFCDKEACLFPVTEKTLAQWCDIYNQRMQHVPNASYMSQKAAEALLQRGDGYFVHKDQRLLGIGTASGNTIGAVISVISGSGETVIRTLAGALSGEMINLEVASANLRAVALYKRLGFITVQELSQWYQVYPRK